MITQIIRKQFFCVTDVRVIGKLIPREFFCVIGVYIKYHMEAPKVTQKNSFQKALCNRCPV